MPLPRLRWLIPTGEALAPELCRRWLERFPHIPLVNAYGPTECSDDVTHHPIELPARRGPAGAHRKPRRQHRAVRPGPAPGPVPAGVPGELYVGGRPGPGLPGGPG